MNMAEPDYDVIIVGAGPSGTTTAKHLLDHLPNLRVLILEKSSQLPRQKPCGGYIGSELFELFPYLKGHERHFVESESNLGYLHSPDLRYQVSGRTRMLGILRHTFDAYLAGLAQQAGAQIGTRSRVVDVKPQSDQIRIKLQDGRNLTTKILVGADGATSIVARRTGLHDGWKPHQICKTVVKELPVEPSFILDQYGPDRPVHLFLQFNTIPGYAWAFPKAYTINLGLGCFANTRIRLIDYFRLFVRILAERAMIPSDASVENVEAGICPTAGPLNITQGERVVLVGDAAGFVSPLTGAGIVWGMLSGQLAAQTLVEAFHRNQFSASFLNRYQRRWEQRIGRFQTELFVQRAFLTRWCNLFIRIGERDKGIRQYIAQAQTGPLTPGYASNIRVGELLLRVLWSLIKGPFGRL